MISSLKTVTEAYAVLKETYGIKCLPCTRVFGRLKGLDKGDDWKALHAKMYEKSVNDPRRLSTRAVVELTGAQCLARFARHAQS